MASDFIHPQNSDLIDLPVYQRPEIIRWSQIMASNYHKLLGKKLVPETDTPQLAKTLFYAPFVLVSHGTQPEPIFNYGNQTALQLWSLSWEQFIQTPSAASAEPVAREERAIMLQQAKEQGYIENYRGTRISSEGKRFTIEQVTIWNLVDESGQKCGQAATYPTWKWL